MQRIIYALVAVASTAALVALSVDAGTRWWAAGLLWLAPDVALLGGMAQGRLNPRAVPLYNALHSLWGPALAVILAAVGIAPLVIAAAWLSHIAVDRALGYGLRARDGFQRA